MEEKPELEHVDDENGGRDCWCKPDMILDWNGRELWVHHGFGEELPPASVVVSAIADLIADR